MQTEWLTQVVMCRDKSSNLEVVWLHLHNHAALGLRDVLQSEHGYICCPSLPFLVPDCLCWASLGPSALTVLTYPWGILSARHGGLWEPCGKLKASSDCIPLPASLSCSTDIDEVSGAMKAEITVVGMHWGSHANAFWTATYHKAQLSPALNQVLIFYWRDIQTNELSCLWSYSSQAKAMTWFYWTAWRVN